jgi:Zn-dependent protease
MGLLGLLYTNPLGFFLLVLPLLYSVILHEIAHGWVARWYGDDTAGAMGRLSLNPLKHLDPIGTLALFLIGFGWAKPVPVDYSKLRNLRAGLIAVSFAGCLMNIALAAIALFLLQFAFLRDHKLVFSLLVVVARINIMLGAFNLLPIPPLDGSKILFAVLPPKGKEYFVKLQPLGLLLLFGLLFTGMLDPLIRFIENAVLFGIGFFFGLGR